MDLEIWARTMADQLNHHMDTEREVLTRYGHLAEETTDERLRYLLNLILDDEVRHHRLFAEMVNWLRAEGEDRPVAGPRVPSDSARPHAEADERILVETEQLLAFEHEDLQELRGLRKDATKVKDTAWWVALIEAMEHDTHKHIALLEYIRDSLTERRP